MGGIQGPDAGQRRIDVFYYRLHATLQGFLQILNPCESYANLRAQSD